MHGVLAEVFISLVALRALLSVGMHRVVIFDKLSSLRAQIEPGVEELRPIDSLVPQTTPDDHFVGTPGNIGPLLVTPGILGLEDVTLNVDANFCAQSTDIVRGDGLVHVECLYRHHFVPPIHRHNGIPDYE